MCYNDFRLLLNLKGITMSTSLKSLINIIDNANSHVQASLNLSDEMIEKMYQLGVYHGLFSDENYGFHDRKNSVYCLIGILYDMKEEN